MSPIALLVVIAVVLVVGGAGLLWWGLRGRRVDDHPICRRCGFDLFGRPDGSVLCSECGADLWRPAAIRVGRRERRHRAIAWALPPIVAGAGWIGLVGWGTATGVDWNRHKPAWLLTREADGTSALPRDAAIAELQRRLEDGKLPAAFIDSVQEKALAYQADVKRPWVPAWGLFIEASRLAGKLPEERWRRYLAHSAALTLEARPRVRRGDPLPVRVVRGPARVGNPNAVAAVLDVRFARSLRVGKEVLPVIDPDAWRPRHMAVVGRNNLSATVLESATDFNLEALPRLADGPQTVRVTAYVLPIQPTAAPPARPAYPFRGRPPPAPPEPEDDPKRTHIELEAAWTLTPADQPPVGLVLGPALRPDVERAVRLAELQYDIRTQTPRLVGTLRCDQPGVTLTCDAFVRVGYAGRLWAGPLVCGPNERLGADLAVEVPGPGIEARAVDVILRPSVAKAVRTVDIVEIWGEDVVIKDVPVRYPDDAAMATSP